jgi:hypothetical protein
MIKRKRKASDEFCEEQDYLYYSSPDWDDYGEESDANSCYDWHNPVTTGSIRHNGRTTGAKQVDMVISMHDIRAVQEMMEQEKQKFRSRPRYE